MGGGVGREGGREGAIEGATYGVSWRARERERERLTFLQSNDHSWLSHNVQDPMIFLPLQIVCLFCHVPFSGIFTMISFPHYIMLRCNKILNLLLDQYNDTTESN